MNDNENAQFSSTPTTRSHWASLLGAVNGNPLEELRKYLPEDLEMQDIGPLAALIDQYMNEQYGEFEPEIVHTPEKDYYLPALKVLLRDADGVLASPGYRAVWEGGELAAECHDYKRQVYKRVYLYMQFMNGATLSFGEDDIKDVEIEEKPHTSPHEGCDCGIYGTVNLDEIADYLSRFEYRLPNTPKRAEYVSGRTYSFNIQLGRLQSGPNVTEAESILCIIEPSPGADVVLSRKGWKAGHAFVSEIVGETISLEDASALLSIAWKRNIDIRRLFNEDR